MKYVVNGVKAVRIGQILVCVIYLAMHPSQTQILEVEVEANHFLNKNKQEIKQKESKNRNKQLRKAINQ